MAADVKASQRMEIGDDKKDMAAAWPIVSEDLTRQGRLKESTV